MADVALLRLRAALGFAQLQPRAPEVRMLRQWLDSWCGIGHIVVGMFRHGWDLQLTQYGDGYWRATFYVTGRAHSIAGGAAWTVLSKRQVSEATELRAPPLR